MKKLASKSLCWILVCVMVLAQLLVPIQADAAGRTVYVDITGTGWSQVNVYTWDAQGAATTGTWPGSAMTRYVGNIYSYQITDNAVNIIFNDGSAQTGDLAIPTDGKDLYSMATQSWSVCQAGCNHNWIDGICKTCGTACGHKWSNGKCLVCSLVCGHRNWIDGACVDCHWTCSHSFDHGMCSICGIFDPNISNQKTYYLFGWINGGAYGCEEDWENLGSYQFVGGRLTATFTEDSYVGIKTGDNADWFMTLGYSQGRAAVFYDTDTGVAEKMLVPGGAELTFTLTENPDGSLTLSYQGEVPECDHSYQARQVYAATCNSDALYELICSQCGHRLNATSQDLESLWLSTVPEGMDSSDFTSKTVYRYRELADSSWTRFSTKQVVYVDHWPAGFDTTNEKYAMYDHKSEKVSAFENAATRQVIDQDDALGYLYYHWCCEGDAYSVAEKNDTHDRFHVFFSNTPPDDADGYDPSDDSYRFDENYNTCDDCSWFFAVPVNSQVYSTYTADTGWSDWSDWSETEPAATKTRQVQRRTRYNYQGEAFAGHSYTSELTTSPTCTQGSVTTYTCTLCGHSYTEVGNPWSHNYVNGKCTMCGAADPNYVVPKENIYLVGFINGANHGCEEDAGNMGDYKFVDGKLVVTFTQDSYVFLKKEGNAAWYMSYTYSSGPRCNFYNTASNFVREKMLIPGGVEVTIYLSAGAGDSYELSYTTPQMVCPHENHDLNGICSACGQQLTHLYIDGVCACGAVQPETKPLEYFLFGYINGANYACEEDYENMGQYKFVDGKLVAIFTQDSYVGVKTTDNADWFMTNGYTGEYGVARLYNTKTLGNPDKLYVPGGVEVTFTLEVNWDKTLSLSYTTAEIQTSVKPTLTLKVPTLEFKDMITVNAMFTAENIEDVVEMGMITYTSKVDAWSVETADCVIPGTTYDANTGRYIAHSQGIHAKYLGDSVYMTVYAKLKDGSYVYCDKIAPYSPVQYATNQLKNSTDAKLKQLCAAMLNYGAEAQLFFGHNTGSLADASLTAAQKALPAAYDVSMTGSVPAASAAKQGSLANNKGFAKRTPSISFEGAFCINYFFTPNYAPDNGITLCYWTAEDFNKASVLSTSNATGSIKMVGSGTGEYRGDITGISAKDLSEAVYVSAVYTSGGTTWTSGVLGYSIGAYCASQISKGAAVAGLAKATAVYGYHAQQYFG